MRLEDEVAKSAGGSPLLWALNKPLGLFSTPAIKHSLELVGKITKSVTSNSLVDMALIRALDLPFVKNAMAHLADYAGDALNSVDSRMRKTANVSVEDLLFTMFKIPGVPEGVWLLTIGLRPIMQNIEPEFFVVMIGMLMNDRVRLKALPMILSIAAPLLQALMSPRVFEHLGELDAYTEEGFARYIGKEV